MTEQDLPGEWTLRRGLLVIVGVLLFLGAVGACDPPRAAAALGQDHPLVAAAVYSAEQAAAAAVAVESVSPCPANPDPGNRRAPFDPAGIGACIRYVWPDDIEDRAIAVVFGHSVLADGSLLMSRNIGSRSNPRFCVESGGNPNALGGIGEIGVMQLHPAHFGRRGFAGKLGHTKADAYDPETNITLGLELFRQAKSGWRSWTCAARVWGTGK